MKTIVSALAGASLLCLALPAAADSPHASGGASHGGGGFSHAPAGGGAPGAGHWNGGAGHWSGAGRWSGAGAAAPGGFNRGAFAGARGFHGDHFHRAFHSFPVFVSGFGLGLGFAALDPWFYGPYYGFYEPYPYYAWGYAPYDDAGPPPPSYYTPRSSGPAAPPAADAPAAPAACGSWVWDSAKQAYNWSPCAT